MENENQPRTKDDFYAVVAALTRFIETADNDVGAPPQAPQTFEKV